MDICGSDTGVGSKKWWGPRIWRILHSLAEISDRIDCGPAWRVVLAKTAEMLPCAVCRNHFHTHCRAIHLTVGKSPREALRHHLWTAHMAAGGALAEEALSEEYGCAGNRVAVIRAVSELIEEVFTALRNGGVYDRFTVGRLVDWHRSVRSLTALLQTPLVAPPGRSARHAGNRRRM
jgi:hypothetical protein